MKKTTKKIKSVGEKAAFGNFQGPMFKAKEGKQPKRYTVKTKKRKGFEKKLLLAIPRAIFKGKGRNNENATGGKNRNERNNEKTKR